MAASKSPQIRLLHIRDEIDHLQSHFINIDYEQFAGNYILLRATERAILIVSEAVRMLPEELTKEHSDIPWQAIRAIGNIIRHEYERVDPRVLWDVVQNRLPALRAVTEILLSRP